LQLDPHKVFEFLAQYGAPTQQIFLEYLVTKKKSTEEVFHTTLATILFSKVVPDASLKSAGKASLCTCPHFVPSSPLSSHPFLPPIIVADSVLNELDEAFAFREDKTQSFESFVGQRTDPLSQGRSKLLAFLKLSQYYNAGTLVAKFGESGLHAELAIVYFKLGQHEGALELMVYKLKDYSGAENYCLQSVTGQDEYEKKMRRKDLFLILLKVYLKPQKGFASFLPRPALSFRFLTFLAVRGPSWSRSHTCSTVI